MEIEPPAARASAAYNADAIEADPINLPPLSQPPPTHRLTCGPLYPTYEALEKDLNDFAVKHGYFIVRSRSRKKNKHGMYTRVDLQCDRGLQRPSDSLIRHSSISKAGCRWAATAQALAIDGFQWSLSIVNGNHNSHNPSITPEQHVGRQGFTEEQRAFTLKLAEDPVLRNRKIKQQLRSQFPDVCFITKDLDNLHT
jgi:hypothetical protein